MKPYLQKLKLLFSLKSFRSRIIVTVLLLIFTIVLLWIGGFFETDSNGNSTVVDSLSEELEIGKNINLDVLAGRCNRDIDSILYSFGIKKEWINTTFSSDYKRDTTKQEKSADKKKEKLNVKWFVKEVSVPKDITTAEINLDLSLYMNFLGLETAVNEDIRNTAINYAVYSPVDTSRAVPLARIRITPTDKIKRDAGSVVLILNHVDNFKKETLDLILNTVNEFSYIFPRNPEDIELQSRLIQQKDVLISVTAGTSDNYDADFRIGMDEKEVREKVKSIYTDFPSVKTAVISKINPQVPNDILFRMLIEEFRRNGIRAYRDTVFTKLLAPDEEDSDNKVSLIVSRIKDKITMTGKAVSVLTFSNDDFLSFLDEIQTLKKRGYKFQTFSSYVLNEEQKEKQREEAEAKEKEMKKELQKKKEQTKAPKVKKKK